MATRLRFPVQSKFQFRDKSGKIYTLESPELHQFLLQLANRTGGTATDLVDNSQDRLNTSENSLSTLSLKTAILELQVANISPSTKKQNLAKYIFSGVL